MQPSRILLEYVHQRVLLESFIDLVHEFQCQHHPRPRHLPATFTSYSRTADLGLSEEGLDHDDWTVCEVSRPLAYLCTWTNMLQRITGLCYTLIYHWRNCK
jgi:hypothetical protein